MLGRLEPPPVAPIAKTNCARSGPMPTPEAGIRRQGPVGGTAVAFPGGRAADYSHSTLAQ